MDKLRVGIIGATGMVGQRFITLLAEHPWFEINALAASERSAGRAYAEAVGARWKMAVPMPEQVKAMTVLDASDVDKVAGLVNLVFCAVDMPKDQIKALEESYAHHEIPVVSNNSANRKTPDVPMLVPEINPEHLALIDVQKKRLGTKRGFIVVKPNCSIQSYTPMLFPLMEFEPTLVVATTYQAISGAGKTFKEWPEMMDNIIPLIGGEEEKSEQEPLQILGKLCGSGDSLNIAPASLLITTQCIRVPITDGHTAAVFVSFAHKPSKEEILRRWKSFEGEPQRLGLPSAPAQFITYFDEENRPQARLDRDLYAGMGVSAGRLREDSHFDYKFVGLSHNTLRGAAGGGVLMAEMLKAKGYLG
jgi:aspartate-semialdehyde dehydrogenase